MNPNERKVAREKIATLANTVRQLGSLVDSAAELDPKVVRQLASIAKSEAQAVIGYTRVVDRRAKKATAADPMRRLHEKIENPSLHRDIPED
jgi:hypothetical protein